jgi:serralysin
MPESTLLHPMGCECGACGGYPTEKELDLYGVHGNVDGTGGTIGGKTVFSIEQVIANLNRTSYPGSGIPGPAWSNDGFDARPASGDPMVLRFGFHNATTMFAEPYVYRNAQGQLVGRTEYFGFAPFSAAQMEAARKTMQLWDDLIQVRFEEVPANAADITFGNYTNQPGTQAYAFLPYNYSAPSTKLAGDVWVNVNQASNLQLDNGFYGLHTLVHEVGHALGLQHPGAYNAAPGLSITYANNAEYYQDTRQYSVMSYFNSEFSGAGHIDWNRLSWVYGQTPLLHDIATIQWIYGADPTTRTGDTVYGFNSNAGRDVYDFTVNTLPVISIYDAGGNDTLDFSGWNTASKIDLTPGAFSSGGGSGVVPLDVLKARGLLPASYTEEQYLQLRLRYNAPDGMLKDNISIAYGTIIENAVGGGGDDVIIGNHVGNVLNGGAGNDRLEGRDGDDVLIGGLGADIMIGGTGNDFYYVDDAGDQVIELPGEGTDTVSSSISYALTDNVENLVLTGNAVTGTGNALDNIIVGNAMSNHLFGGAGDDVLIGGDGVDYLTGGAGRDLFVAEINQTKVASKDGPISLDVILDFQSGVDKIDLRGIDANAFIDGHQAFNFVKNASGNKAGELFVRSFGNINAAEKALGIDIDGVDGPSPYTGKVTVVFGNTDGGAPEFALVLVGTDTITVNDFIFG